MVLNEENQDIRRVRSHEEWEPRKSQNTSESSIDIHTNISPLPKTNKSKSKNSVIDDFIRRTSARSGSWDIEASTCDSSIVDIDTIISPLPKNNKDNSKSKSKKNVRGDFGRRTSAHSKSWYV
jgi:hypothetical protein